MACEIEAEQTTFDFETVFRTQYVRIARVISRVINDHARAEELAVEVFLKVWKTPALQREMSHAWLYRAAVRKGLDELRRRHRRTHYERLLHFARVKTPEEIHTANEEQQRIRQTLASMDSRQAELLLLRSNGLTYEEVAAATGRNCASIGTQLRRAQEAFRKKYVKRYGDRDEHEDR